MTDQMEAIASYGREMGRLAAQTRDFPRFTKLSRKLHLMADAEVDRLQKEATSQGIKIACGQGCSNCCKRLVIATVPEVISVVEHMWANQSAEEREAFLSRADLNAEENEEFWKYRRLSATAPCPFLVDDACSIYELRPLTCRALSSDDPAKCLQHEVETNDPLPSVVPFQNQISNIAAQLVSVCREAGVISGGYEFGAMVATILRNPALLNGLQPMVPELERLKLFSEFTVEEKTVEPELASRLKDPVRLDVLELLADGNAEAVLPLLPKQSSASFTSLYRHCLPFYYRNQDELEEWWASWGKALEDFENANLDSREVFSFLQPFNTFSLAYAGKDVRPYLQRFMGVLHRHASRALPHLTAEITRPRRPGKFRVGYVSYRIKEFNGSRWSIGWLQNHTKEIETYVINLTEQEDSTSLVFRRKADNYFHVPLPVANVAAFIRELDLDALIFTDVGMCGHTTQLSLLRLARRQFGAWGHPVTSGSPNMDGYLSSEMMEPGNGQDHYTEELICLPGSGLTYMRRNLVPSHKSPSELGVPEDGYLFFCQNSLKLVPKDDWVYEEIASRSKLPIVFLEGPAGRDVDYMKERILKKVPNARFLPRMSRADYLRVLQLAEASLDPPGWNGGNTTIDALTLGTPVVSIAGDFMRGRHCMAFLNQANVGGLIAKDAEDYIDLALDEERRRELFSQIDSAAIYEDLRPIQAIDRLLLNALNKEP